MLGARIVQGFGGSCPDAMGPAVVSYDTITAKLFKHQLTKRLHGRLLICSSSMNVVLNLAFTRKDIFQYPLMP